MNFLTSNDWGIIRTIQKCINFCSTNYHLIHWHMEFVIAMIKYAVRLKLN